MQRTQEFAKQVVDMRDITVPNCTAALDTTGLLTDNTRSAITKCLDKSDAVRLLISSRVRAIYASKLNLGDAAAFPTTRAFTAVIDAQTAKLANLSAFNCAIHLPTYEAILVGKK